MSEAPSQRPNSRGVVLCRWTLAWGFRLLTRPGRHAAANLVAWLWFDVIRYRRRLILDNLAIAFPDWPEARRRDVGRKSLQNLCYSATEAFLLPFLTKENLPAQVTFHGVENRTRALASGKGVFLLVPHLGNVEALMAACSLNGLEAHVIAKAFRSRFFTELVYGTRESFGTRFIVPHGGRTAFEVLHALRRNECVAFVIDQFMRKEFGVETTFFGRKTGTAYGLALFALKTRAPVISAYCYRDATDRLHLCFEDEVPLVEDADRDRAIQATTQSYNHRIEDIIRRHPEQWMWVHRRWKPFA